VSRPRLSAGLGVPLDSLAEIRSSGQNAPIRELENRSFSGPTITPMTGNPADPFDAVNRFLGAAAGERNLAKPTIRAYASDLQLFLRRTNPLDLAAVTTPDLRAYIERLESELRYQDATIRRHVATLKVFFTFAEAEGLLVDSPARKLRGRYSIVRRLPRVMSLREVGALLRAARRGASRCAAKPRGRITLGVVCQDTLPVKLSGEIAALNGS
jgi:integrase